MNRRRDGKAVLHWMVTYGARRKKLVSIDLHRPGLPQHETGPCQRKRVGITRAFGLNLAVRICRRATRSGDTNERVRIASRNRMGTDSAPRAVPHAQRAGSRGQWTVASGKIRLLFEDRETTHAESEQLQLAFGASFLE
jgi:hypothetical protein